MTKKIIITGASSGIGAELVCCFASSEWIVLAVARRIELLRQLEQQYPKWVVPVVADVATDEGRHAVLHKLTPLDQGIYLIHNAGIAEPLPLENHDAEHWRRHLQINLEAPAVLTALLHRYLRGGRILSVSSSLAHRPGGALSAYSATKAALLALVKSWNAQFNKENIFFASVQPGTVNTPMQDKLRTYPVEQFPEVEMFQRFKTQNQLLSPEISAKFIKWLLCETTNDDFSKGEWNIYDTSHHQSWAKPGEVVQRDKCPGEKGTGAKAMYDTWKPFMNQYGKPMLYVLLGVLAGSVAQHYFCESAQ